MLKKFRRDAASRFRSTSIGLCWIGLLAGCGKNDCRKDEGMAEPVKNVQITRLEEEIKLLKDTSEANLFLDKYPLFSEKYLQRSRLPVEVRLEEDILKLAQDPHIDTMYHDVRREFADLTWLQNELSPFFGRVRHFYPDFYVPPVYTLVSGFGVDLEVKDSVIVIGLEYFLSDSGRYRPPQIPNYILRRLKKRFLVPEIGMVVADSYCKINPLDNTMMGEMLKWGRVYYFLERTMPCLQDSLLTGHTEQELKDLNSNLKTIWAHYLDKSLFFSTDLFLIKKYCDERPKVVEIGDNCPGRVGRWLGWLIVKRWAEKKGMTLQQVMAETDSRKIFNESGFKP
ncbi:MAG TPA: hypothetical protein PKY12_03125 [Catalimonadaceae bacterium]|nr:hypothetical protein [Catalimonadaceae bacterium]